ncbi:MAG TPA: tail fiber protein [Stellaceae bacterium]|nr:tail fiber protein [Stellaceae bacterium]
MSDQFLGEVRSFGINFAPNGWAMCDGQIMAISQSSALFALLGTMYGGNGTTTFQLPNLQSRVPMHFGTSPAGNNYSQGEIGGAENVSLTINNLPMHSHAFIGSNTIANTTNPATGSALAQIENNQGQTGAPYYAPDATTQSLNPGSIGPAGGNQPHTNIQPYLTITWCIALTGVFPARG